MMSLVNPLILSLAKTIVPNSIRGQPMIDNIVGGIKKQVSALLIMFSTLLVEERHPH